MRTARSRKWSSKPLQRFAAWLIRGAVLMLVALYAAWQPLAAAEVIYSYNSTIEVKPDSTLEVEEIIRVRAEGNRIRRGIFRDFPVRYPLKSGLLRYVGFKILEVKRDGQTEDWHQKPVGNVARIYIGNENQYLPRGDYTYTIRYRTTRQLRHFEDFDELYWNVTGNFWEFPIESATARIVLPDGAIANRLAAYVGRFGRQGSDFRMTREGNAHVFQTTRILDRYEGLTIAVGWPKGFVEVPGTGTKLWWQIWDNIGFAVLLVGVAGVAGFYTRTWVKIGQDPDQGTIIPLFRPPDGLSPAALSYLHYMGFASAGRGASKAFIAALMSLAAKGAIQINDAAGDISITKKDAPSDLPGGEKSIMRWLLGSRQTFAFEKKNGKTLVTARSKFRQAILNEYEGVFFRNNRGYFAAGIALSILCLVAFFVLQQPGEDLVGSIVFTLISATLGAIALALGLRRLMGWVPGGGSVLLGILLTIVGFVVLVPAGFITVFFADTVTRAAAFAVGLLAIMGVSFFYLLRAVTPAGRDVMDAIEGFKLYLSVAEEQRLNMSGAPGMSQQLFERYLPFAIALGVEKPWAEAFEAFLARTVPEPERRHYRPRWYSGSSWDSASFGRATSTMVSSMSSSMASAMPTQSSSGSGGGGFSGGGGGGGGGGGW